MSVDDPPHHTLKWIGHTLMIDMMPRASIYTHTQGETWVHILCTQQFIKGWLQPELACAGIL